MVVVRSDDSDSVSNEMTEVGTCLYLVSANGQLDVQREIEKCFAGVTRSELMTKVKNAVLAAYVVPQLGVTLDDQTQKIVLSLLCLQKSYEKMTDSMSIDDLQPAADLCFGRLDDTTFGQVNDALQGTIEYMASSEK